MKNGPVGTDALLQAGAELLTAARLQDVLSFVGVRAVAHRADVMPGTVTHHFGSGPRHNRRGNPQLAEGVARHALMRLGIERVRNGVARLRAEIEELRAGDEGALRRFARAAAGALERDRDESRLPHQHALHACLLAAPQDPVAAELLRSYYAEADEQMMEVYEGLTEATGRQLAPGVSARDLTVAMSALVDGFIIRHRFDPTETDIELLADAALRLFQATTTDRRTRRHPSPADLLEPPGEGELDEDAKDAVVLAAQDLYDESFDWDAVTLAAVADRAKVNRADVRAHFGDEHGLAAAVLMRYIPFLERAIERDRLLPVERVLTSHLQRLIEIVREHRQVSGAYLQAAVQANTERGPARRSHLGDPRLLLPLPQVLAPALRRHAPELHPDLTASDTSVFAFATFVTNSALALALTQTTLPSSETAHHLVSIILDGARRPATDDDPA